VRISATSGLLNNKFSQRGETDAHTQNSWPQAAKPLKMKYLLPCAFMPKQIHLPYLPTTCECQYGKCRGHSLGSLIGKPCICGLHALDRFTAGHQVAAFVAIMPLQYLPTSFSSSRHFELVAATFDAW